MTERETAQHQTTIAQALTKAAEILRASGVPEARREASSLLAHTTALDRTAQLTHAERTLAPEELSMFESLIRRRATGEPLQYITGRQDFYNLTFEVTPDVLIPRPETELLVEAALELLEETPHPRVCDVGTGSGCIIVSILWMRQDAQAHALDISPAALAIAERNAERNNVRDRMTLIASDCFDALDSSNTRFSMIVSNPPYVPENDLATLQREVRDHEPRVALTPGGDGLRIVRRLLDDAPRFLTSGGHLLMEIGFNQRAAVERLIDSRVWTLADVRPDLQGIPRIVVVRSQNRLR